MDATAKPARRTAGFTLVELLTVIVIIAILVSLVTAAVIAARSAAKRAVITLEINQLQMALEEYKNQYGAYPPDFTDAAAVNRHLRKAFPRYHGNMPAYANLSPATALVFWLAGPAGMGFSANPANPFDPGEDLNLDGVLNAGEDTNGNGRLDIGSRLPVLFEFDEKRLLRVGDCLEYRPDAGDNARTPYIYFKSRPDAGSGRREYGATFGTTFVAFSYLSPYLAPTAPNVPDVCVPYLASASGDPTVPATVRRWKNPKTFQILCAGLDGVFGNGAPDGAGNLIANPFRYTESGLYFSEGDFDNQTNFTKGKLEDEME